MSAPRAPLHPPGTVLPDGAVSLPYWPDRPPVTIPADVVAACGWPAGEVARLTRCLFGPGTDHGVLVRREGVTS